MRGATMGHVFDCKSKTSRRHKELAVTVLDRMDTLAQDMISGITDSPAGYARVEAEAPCAEEIRRSARLRGATILAHNSQLPAIQDAADHVGDSLALSRIAADATEDTIVFCGVHFMAE